METTVVPTANESLEVGDASDSDDLEEDDAPDGESGPVDEVEMPEVVVRRSAAGVNRAAGTENPVEGG